MFLVVLDFEGVLVKGEYLPALAKIAGRSDDVENLTKDGIEGRISWREALERRLELLKGIEYTECVEATKALEPYKGAKEFVDFLRKLGNVKIGVITGCFDIAVNPIKEALKLDFAVANTLIFDNGKLAGARIIVDTNKDLHIANIAKQYGVKMENVIAIGDGANDINMISKAGLGIGFNPAPIVKNYAKVNLYTERLDEAIPFIQKFIKEKQKIESPPRRSTLGKELKVLICDPIESEGVEILKDFGFEVMMKTGISQEALKNEVAKYHVLIVRSRTKVTKEIIDAGKNLKIIARAGAGVDNIDVEYAEKKGIKVICAPEAVITAVAELTFGLLLSLARQIPRADVAMKGGMWIKKEVKGWELHGKIVGIIGFGRIGQKVARLAKAFGMKILVCELNSPPENVLKELDAQLVPLAELLRKSDVITLHVPLTRETYRMIGEREIQQMKNGVYLVNTSRGQVVDEKALFEALKTGKIAGASLDVYEEEPPKNSPLIKLPNVICTPHIGAQTVESQKNASIIIAHKIVEALVYPIESVCEYKCHECPKY